MTEAQMQKMLKFPESHIKLGDAVEYTKDNTKKKGIIYSVNSNTKAFDILCEHENIVDKDIQEDSVERKSEQSEVTEHSEEMKSECNEELL